MEFSGISGISIELGINPGSYPDKSYDNGSAFGIPNDKGKGAFPGNIWGLFCKAKITN